MSSKENCQIRHAKMRAVERYGLELTDTEYNQICNMIDKTGGRILAKQSGRVSVLEIDWKNKKYVVVYDKNRNTIVSFLPNKTWFESEN